MVIQIIIHGYHPCRITGFSIQTPGLQKIPFLIVSKIQTVFSPNTVLSRNLLYPFLCTFFKTNRFIVIVLTSYKSCAKYQQ